MNDERIQKAAEADDLTPEQAALVKQLMDAARPYDPVEDRWEDELCHTAAVHIRLTSEVHNNQVRMLAERDAEIEKLQAWKESAMSVLNDWDGVFETLGSPESLGESKAESSRLAVERLQSALAQARRDALEEAAKMFDETLSDDWKSWEVANAIRQAAQQQEVKQ